MHIPDYRSDDDLAAIRDRQYIVHEQVPFSDFARYDDNASQRIQSPQPITTQQ